MNGTIDEATAIETAKKFIDARGMDRGEVASVHLSGSGKSWVILFERSAEARARFVCDPDHGPIIRVNKKSGKAESAWVI